jgi:uncharacterized protein
MQRVWLVIMAVLLIGTLGARSAHATVARAQSTAACTGSGQSIPAAAPQPGVDYDPTYPLIAFINQCGDQALLAVGVETTTQEQEQGLMNVSNLPPDQGDLFVFDNLAGGQEVRVGFWMEDTPIPLSIAFIGKDGTVHEIQDMQAETTDLHMPAQPFLYAVEANQGWFAENGITAGALVDLSPALATITPPSGSS